MSDIEQIYALFVEANPVVDPATLPETYEDARPMLRAVPANEDGVVDAIVPVPGSSPRRSNRRTAVLAAAVAIMVVGVATMLLRSSAGDVAPPATEPSTSITEAFVPVTPTAQATAFIDRLAAGDIDGAIELLADPLGSIWFPPLGQVTSSEDVRAYLDFYLAIGTATDLSGCTSELSGPRTIVICQADQQSTLLEQIGLDFPVYAMQFQVWKDGIRIIEFGPGGSQGMNAAFTNSRFFEFRDTMLIPRGLVQESGDPVWSKTNGELMWELVSEFLANNP